MAKVGLWQRSRGLEKGKMLRDREEEGKMSRKEEGKGFIHVRRPRGYYGL